MSYGLTESVGSVTYAVGTNDVAARWAGLPVRGTRFKA